MTPLITEMIPLIENADLVMWFDIGGIGAPRDYPAWTNETWDTLKLPYDYTGVVIQDPSGDKTLIVFSYEGDMLVMSGFIKTYATIEGIVGPHIMEIPVLGFRNVGGNIQFLTKDVHTTSKALQNCFMWAYPCITKIHAATESYKGTIKANSLTNKRRAAKGKNPLVYTWHTVKLGDRALPSEPKGGTHASPRRHQVRGHWRNIKTGEKIWINSCWKGDASKGTVFKDYKLSN